MNKNKGFYVLILMVAFLLIKAYSNHFNNPFEFDDIHTIVNNNAIRSLKNIPHFFADARTFSTLPSNQIYRPGLTTLNALDYWIGGKREPIPFYYHMSIFISFILLGILLYFLFLKIFDETFYHKWNKYFALFGAAFYCLHTANAETVNYIIARSDSFSTLMIVLSFVIYLYKPDWQKKLIYLIPVSFGFFVKEPTIMVAPLLFTYILLFNKNLSIPNWFSKKNLGTTLSAGILLLPLFILILILFLLSTTMAADTFNPSNTPRLHYILTQPFVILHYFNNFILPLNLSADTDWLPITTIMDYRVIVGSLFIIGLVSTAIYCSTKLMLRPVAFGIIWFLLALLPTSLTPLAEVMNDHRPFFPYIGLVMTSAWLLGIAVIKLQKQIESNSSLKFGFILILFSILSVHAYGVHQRNKVWSLAESLWHDVIVKSPKNARGLVNYGTALMTKKDYKNALLYFEQAQKLWPDYYYVYLNMATLKAAMGDNREVEANFKKSLLLETRIPYSYFYYSNWLKSQKRYEEALDIINSGLLLSKNDIQINSLQNEIIKTIANKKNELIETEQIAKRDPTPSNFLKLSVLYYANSNFENCIAAATRAIQLKPDYAKAYNNICSAQNALGNYTEAIHAGEQAVRLEPNYQLARNNLKNSLNCKTKIDSMLTVLRMQPTAGQYVNLSFIYYDMKCYEKCIEAAKTALKYDAKKDVAYNNICCSYIGLRQWDKAIEAGEQGLKINPNSQLLKDNLEISKRKKKQQILF